MTTETATFLQIITAEAEAVQQFVDLLKLEQSTLSKGKTDDLPAFAEQKSRLAIHLKNLATQRNTSLAVQGFGADRTGVESWCAKYPDEKTASMAWTKILSLAGEARELNRVNGELIQMRMHHNAKALEALQGGRSSLDLYGPDGQSTTAGNQRINDAV